MSYSVGNELGCGFMGGFFQRLSYWSRKPSVHSLPSTSRDSGLKEQSMEKSQKPPAQNSRRRRSHSEETAAFPKNSNSSSKPCPKKDQKPTRQSALVHPRPSVSQQKKVQGRRPSDAARSSTSSSNGLALIKVSENKDLSEERKQRRDSIDYQQQPDDSKALVRATSNNTMLLGNLKQPGTRNSLSSNSPNGTPKTLDLNSIINGRYSYGKIGGNIVMGNIVKKNSDELRGVVANKLDPEVLKRMGNEAYKQGRFGEALGLYDRAIALDPYKAAYHSNKSAALISLGLIIEAVLESEEAIRIEPSYHRAHHRLATLYIRYIVYMFHRLGRQNENEPRDRNRYSFLYVFVFFKMLSKLLC